MSHFVQFTGYGAGSRGVTVAVSRVTHFWQIVYNGRYGVEIELDTGKTVIVDGFASEVEKKLEAAAASIAKEVA